MDAFKMGLAYALGVLIAQRDGVALDKVDANGANHEPAGSPEGGRFAPKEGGKGASFEKGSESESTKPESKPESKPDSGRTLSPQEQRMQVLKEKNPYARTDRATPYVAAERFDRINWTLPEEALFPSDDLSMVELKNYADRYKGKVNADNASAILRDVTKKINGRVPLVIDGKKQYVYFPKAFRDEEVKFGGRGKAAVQYVNRFLDVVSHLNEFADTRGKGAWNHDIRTAKKHPDSDFKTLEYKGNGYMARMTVARKTMYPESNKVGYGISINQAMDSKERRIIACNIEFF